MNDGTSNVVPMHADQLVILNGGVEIEVQKNDGATENVKVRQLPIRLIPKWAELLMDEPKLVELYTDRDEA